MSSLFVTDLKPLAEKGEARLMTICTPAFG